MKRHVLALPLVIILGVIAFVLLSPQGFIIHLLYPNQNVKIQYVERHYALWREAIVGPKQRILLGRFCLDPFSARQSESYFIQLDPRYLVMISRGPDGVFQSINHIYEQVDPEILEILGDDIGMIVDIRAAREAEEQ